MPFTLLLLPVEVRLQVYEHFFVDHQRIRSNVQPTNAHIGFLRTCKLVNEEASARFHQYISLRHERQIHRFIYRLATNDGYGDRVLCADVANDGRFAIGLDRGKGTPASKLHIALAKLRCLRTLRVFECRQGFPLGIDRLQRLSMNAEAAMFPDVCTAPLSTYEFFLDPTTRIQLSAGAVPTAALVRLRVSGECALPDGAPYTRLRTFAMVDARGTYFDTTCFRALAHTPLESFAYRHGGPLAYELRDAHLAGLLAGAPRTSLRRLVLLWCTRLSTAALADCVRALPSLDYFALALVVPDKLTPDFVRALPPTLRTFKYQVSLRRFSPPFRTERRIVLEAIEEELLRRRPPPLLLCVADEVDKDQYTELFKPWPGIARAAGVILELGEWATREDV